MLTVALQVGRYGQVLQHSALQVLLGLFLSQLQKLYKKNEKKYVCKLVFMEFFFKVCKRDKKVIPVLLVLTY